jgi:hypothetical protein
MKMLPQPRLRFLLAHLSHAEAWHEAGPPIDGDDKATLMNALCLCADGFARLVQKITRLRCHSIGLGSSYHKGPLLTCFPISEISCRRRAKPASA